MSWAEWNAEALGPRSLASMAWLAEGLLRSKTTSRQRWCDTQVLNRAGGDHEK